MKRGHFLRQLRILIWKDLLVEARGRETVLAGAVFALLVLGILLFRPSGILPRPIRDLSRFIGRPGADA